MERNIGANNRRIPPDVKPKGSTSRDLDRRKEQLADETPPEVSDPNEDRD